MSSRVSLAILISAAFAAGQSTTISNLNPANASVGSSDTPLTITGQNMASASTVSWTTPTGQKVTLSSQLVNAAELAATIPAALLTTAGTAQVAVADPQGVLSNQLPFNISLASVAITNGPLTDGSQSVAYNPVTFSAAGGSPPYTWSQSGGTIPAGLGLDPSGILSGTPSTPGTYYFGVRATDSQGIKATGSFSININPSSLKITSPTTLASGIAGTEYPSQVLSATGGNPPYTFTITGSLPSGLTLSNGAIGGIPASAGTSNFTLNVTDSSNPPVSVSSSEQITIRPAAADLVLGANIAAFSLSTGSSGVPPPTVIPVNSSSPAQTIAYSVSSGSTAPWLTVSGGSTTPGSISIALSNAALSLAAANTPYQASVVVACGAASACAGKSQSISVSLSVTSPDPQLSVTPALLTFSASAAAGPSPQALSIQNTGGGSLQNISITAADKWVSIGSYPTTLAAGPAISIAIAADPVGLDPGFYKSAINVVTSSGRTTIPVTLSVSASPSMSLGPAGQQFTMAAGGALGNPNGSFVVNFAGGAPAFTAAVQPGATWLSLGQQFGNSVSFTINPAIAASLAPGIYYGTIQVSSAAVVNSPQDFQVVLTVTPAATPVLPDPQPTGLLFVGSGSIVPAGQTVKLYASSAAAVPYQASASTSDGRTWLSVSPATGTTSASSPASSTVTVSTAGLPAGVYRGGVNYGYAGSSVRTVNVTFIVVPGSVATSSGASSAKGRLSSSAAVPGCVPAQLVPAPSGPSTNFATPASWPSALTINLVNDCGGVVANGQIATVFSNGDPPLALTLIDSTTGLYSGTWTPRGPSNQVTITATASAPGFASAKAQISGQVKPNIAPAIAPNSVLQIFNPEIGGPLAPGNVIQIYGLNFASQTGIPALPLPTNVVGTSVLIGGIQSPLFYVGPGQINAQVPFELAAGKQYQVIVNANGALSTPASVQLNPVAPGILPFPATAQLVAQRPDGSLVSDASPAKPGEFLVLYLAGMGLTDNAVATGASSPGDPLASSKVPPTLTMDGAPVTIVFAGLTPTAVGLYQVNFQVPLDAQDGYREIVLTQSGTVANKTILPVHH